jgi:putative ABC transport system permease protein
MELGPMVRALWRRKSASALVVLEVAVAMVVLVNNFVVGTYYAGLTFAPSGVDEPNLVFITRHFSAAAAGSGADGARAQAADDLARLARLPDVVAAAAVDELPYSDGMQFCTVVRAAGAGMAPVTAWPLRASDRIADALGLRLLRGRAFAPGERGVAILTDTLARRLVPGGEAVGRQVDVEGLPSLRVVGVVTDFRTVIPMAPDNLSVLLAADLPASSHDARYIVRSAPARAQVVAGAVQAALAPGQIVTRVPELSTARSHRIARGATIVMTWMTAIVVGVALAGVLAVTSFSVTERTRQIGVRRALGATRGAIVSYFLIENAVATTVGMVIGLAISVSLNAVLVRLNMVPRMVWWQVAVSMGVFWAAGLLSALIPARRAARIPPTVATRAL